MEEVLARLRSIIRRAAGNADALIRVGDVSLDTRQRDITVNGRKLALSQLEFRCVAYLMHNRGRVVSQGELSEHIYAQDEQHDSNAIEVLIARLRKKLGADFILTRRGHGYVVGSE
jgi:DNA-binding response OmpR family regulator